MLKIRRSYDRLIFNMGSPCLEKMVFILRRGPGWHAPSPPTAGFSLVFTGLHQVVVIQTLYMCLLYKDLVNNYWNTNTRWHEYLAAVIRWFWWDLAGTVQMGKHRPYHNLSLSPGGCDFILNMSFSNALRKWWISWAIAFRWMAR